MGFEPQAVVAGAVKRLHRRYLSEFESGCDLLHDLRSADEGDTA
jgi:hypothetical protein